VETVELELDDLFVRISAENTENQITIGEVTSNLVKLPAIAGPATVTLYPSTSSFEPIYDPGTYEPTGFRFKYLRSAFTYSILRKHKIVGDQSASTPVILPSLTGS